MKDIVLAKKARIERSVAWARRHFDAPSDLPFHDDFPKRDLVITNLQRACEQCIDLANHIVRERELGLPADSRESFQLLAEGGVIPTELAVKLGGMVGFRNVAVHEYDRINIDLVVEIVERHADDLLRFADIIVAKFGGD